MYHKVFFFFIGLIPSITIYAQPYFDVAGMSGWHMPGNLNEDVVSETESYFFVSLPVDLSSKCKLIISPSYENRLLQSEGENKSINLKSSTIPIALRLQPRDSSWSFLGLAAFRANSTQFRFNGDVFQIAGAAIANYKVSPTLTFKAGAYLSREFYGNFFMILAGIDWKINKRLNLFGFVNSNLRLEYHLSKNIFGGFAFKSINTSFREKNKKSYYKLSDNHLSAYADVSLGKKIIWNIEAGHTIFRYIKSRNGAQFQEINQDGFIFKSGIAYRIRFND